MHQHVSVQSLSCNMSYCSPINCVFLLFQLKIIHQISFYSVNQWTVSSVSISANKSVDLATGRLGFMLVCWQACTVYMQPTCRQVVPSISYSVIGLLYQLLDSVDKNMFWNIFPHICVYIFHALSAKLLSQSKK